ncbi:MAG: CcmD family protein [Bacteroidota bacterium]
MKKITLSALLSLLTLLPSLSAQSDGTDFMRSTGKIYVVVAVIAAVFIGIVIFLIFLERKLTKLENQVDSE